MRRPRGAKHLNCGQGQIPDAVSIRERPAEADDRAVPGHWEGDLLAGSANTHIATLVERHSRFVMLVAVDGKDTRSVTKALSTHIGRLPEKLQHSLTWDRGMEMAEHAQFTIATGVKVYFCDPQSPWQRGSNENGNDDLKWPHRDVVDSSDRRNAWSSTGLRVVVRRGPPGRPSRAFCAGGC